ncbi:MFS transporter [Janibacter cremeus]|uniref:MFS transporter n=1 Tax=Janibacter cremeus TaxID=1285192 RepID=UPI0023F6E122|nr:MFS transporter [Janibacter cremeus]WEV78840.1 MFS transporter [Janibacter cremeus]
MSSVWTARGMPSLLWATFLGFSGFAVLMPVAPLWAVHGGADEGGAGLVNGVLLLVTVLTQFTVPAMLGRFGWGSTLAAGLVLLGAPSLGLIATDSLAAILGLSAVRGVGFGILTVTGSAAVAELSDPSTRGKAVGAYGLSIAGPQVVLLPLGSWVAETVGFTLVFAVGALPLLGVPAALALGRALDASPGHAEVAGASGVPSTPRVALTLLRPMVLLVGVTIAGGAVLTFGPQMVRDPAVVIPALALLELMAAILRWWIGGVADRYGAERFVAPFVVLTVVGVSAIAWAVHVQSVPTLLLGAVLLGSAYGALQNLTLVISFAAVTRRHIGLASSIWNVGFDLGTAVGSVTVGAIAVRYDFSVALLVTAAFALLTLPLTLLHRPARRPVT